MKPNGRDDGRRERRLLTETGASRTHDQRDTHETHVVFDFTGMQRPQPCDLALILTARLHTSPEDSVWIRALPRHAWRVLYALGLDHWFRQYPAPGEMN